MKYLFFVQGEGRGHMSQALTLKELLEKRGHQIAAVVVGASPENPIPSFFKEQLDVPLFVVDSPAFVVDKNNQGINLPSSIIRFIRRLPSYFFSIRRIRSIIKDFNPDVLVNFYEVMAGNYYRFYNDKRPMFCLGHQYFLDHPAFESPSGLFARWSMSFYNRLNAPRKTNKIALSFTKENDEPAKNIIICPPLIRRTIKEQKTSDNNFILVYLLNAGYSQEIIKWAKEHAGIKVEAFWNKPEKEETVYGENLTFHALSAVKFINCLASCSAYVATAGFDSIAEAAYLQKNILMIPTKNHYEQKCNAVDAKRAGIAISADNFNLSLIVDPKIKAHSREALSRFKEWADDYGDKIINVLEK